MVTARVAGAFRRGTVAHPRHDPTNRPRWLVRYVLLGLVQSGTVPIILPLAAAPGPTAGFT